MKIPHHRQAAAAAYTRTQTPPAQPLQNAPTAPEANATGEAKSTASVGAPPSDLSADEQRMIDQYFPPRPEMTLRLYGPGREAQTVSPNALGGRLDLNA